MIVTCEQCTTQFHLDDAKVPEGGIRVRCSRCKHAFLVESPNRNDVDRAEDLARDVLDPSASQDDIESDWQFNEEVQPEQADSPDLAGRVAAEAAVDDLLGVSLGDSSDSLGDLEAGLGDSDDSLGDLEAGLGDSHDSLGDLEAGFGDSRDSMSDLGLGSGDSHDALGDFDVDFGLDDLDPGPELDSQSGFDSHPEHALEPKLGMADAEPAMDAGAFEDLGDSGELSDGEAPPEFEATDDLHADAAFEPAATDAGADPASDPVSRAETAAPFDEPSIELGDSREWDDAGAPEAPSQIRDAGVAIEHVPPRAPLESAESPLARASGRRGIDASALEADLDGHPGNVQIARARTLLGWGAVCALCAYAGFAGLVPTAPALRSGGVHWSIAGLDLHEIQGRWIENAVAGPIYVVSGSLRVGAAGSAEPGTLLRVRLVDASGRPIAAESAAVGAPVPSERLREWNLRDLREAQEKGARRLARTPLQRGERRPFLAVLGDLPPTAKGYEITRGE